MAKAYLREHQLCASEECSAIPAPLRPAATEVDHIDALGLQGPRWDDPTNWQSLCHSCHSAKTARESFGR
ncbi:HNH endonuclease [Streptomyces sp. NBC_00299]|uniref:HNH endonuclease n=1 Tax=Streptomyces sp. NBC_00299 TaxID=2975705 RepID=UPI002E29F56F|nr:HNH endonuclease signature motif containing protein [Streptomyces sp. NBC_00299]